MDVSHLDGWVPIRAFRAGSGLRLDWCYLGSRRFTEPFFDQTIASVLRHPFNLLFRRQTSLDDLAKLQTQRPLLTPAGFIFHMSRCGSTLISQMLAKLPACVVISEPGVLSTVLQVHARSSNDAPDPRIEWFRGLVHALAQPRSGTETHLIIKLDAPSAVFLPLIRRAFPAVPYIFVYRDPVEVLVSQRRQRSGQMLPAVLNPLWLGLDLFTAACMSPDEYTARALAFICQTVVEHHERGIGRLVNYRQLPGAVFDWIPQHFGLHPSPGDLKAMEQACGVHAKQPDERFVGDSADKQQEADADLRALAQTWMRPWYDRLEAASALLSPASHAASE